MTRLHNKFYISVLQILVVTALRMPTAYADQTNAVFEAGASFTNMTLAASIQYGLTNNPMMRKSLKDGQIAEARIGQAVSLILPDLRADATYSRVEEVDTFDLGDGPVSLGNEDRYNVTFGASQLLFSGGQVRAALRSAGITRAIAFSGYGEAANALIRDIRVGFYDVLLANAAREVQEASYQQIEDLLEQTRIRHASDAASDFALLTAKVRLANEVPRNISARNDAELAAAGFGTLLHHPAPVVVTGSLEQADILITEAQMLNLAMQQRPMILASELRIQLAEQAVANARSAAMPELRAFFDYSGANQTALGTPEDEWEWGWTAGLTLNWNFWDGNLTRQTVREKQIDVAKLQDDHEAICEQVRLEVRQAWLQLQNARQSVEASRDSVKLAEEALRIAKARHAAGLATYLEFTDANLALRTARLTRLQSLRAHAVAVAQVRYACAMDRDMLIPPKLED